MTLRLLIQSAGVALLLCARAQAQMPAAAPAPPQSRPGVTEPDPNAPARAVPPRAGGSAAPS
jgi:hypothetical protein